LPDGCPDHSGATADEAPVVLRHPLTPALGASLDVAAALQVGDEPILSFVVNGDAGRVRPSVVVVLHGHRAETSE
jgi:hypothetical protein